MSGIHFFRFPRVVVVCTVLVAGLGMLLGFGPVFADGEAIFKQARDYTVQIRTAVELPFDGDSRQSSVGAGFVVDVRRGWVMTNAHVAARSPAKVRMAFRNRDYQPAEKVYVDPYLDVAILRLHESQRQGLKAARLDCDRLPRVGHPVGAFGHPWKLMYTGTRGIVSGATTKLRGEMLQTDAPINGGNSGGPLISLKTNRVVGINTSTISDMRNQNTNFAVPMVYACRILKLLQAGKDPSPPLFNAVYLSGIEERRKLVVANSYMDKADLDLRQGDEILGIAGLKKHVKNEGQLIHHLRGHGDQVKLVVLRDGKRQTINGRVPLAKKVTDRQGVFFSGALVAQSSYPDMPELNGQALLMVHYVEPGSTADTHEIYAWDFLLSVNGRRVTSLGELDTQLQAAQHDKQDVVLIFKRLFGVDTHIFKYLTRTIPVQDLKHIGAPPAHLVGLEAGAKAAVKAAAIQAALGLLKVLKEKEGASAALDRLTP